MKTLRLFITLCLIHSLLPGLASSGEHLISATQTRTKYHDTLFVLSGNRVQMSHYVNGGAAEYNFRFGPGISVGGGLHTSRWYVESDEGGSSETRHYANLYYIYGIGQINLFPERKFQPYIGFTMGPKIFSLHSKTNVSLDGYSLSARVGFEYRPVDVIGFLLTYQKAYDSLDDDADNEIRTNHTTIALTARIYFRRRY